MQIRQLFIINMVMFGSLNLFSQDWNEVTKVLSSDIEGGDFFGWSCDISGNFAIIGAFREDNDTNNAWALDDAGSAYIFEKVGCNWVQKQKLIATEREDVDLFGYSVAISGDYAIVGAYAQDYDENYDNYIEGAGAAYIYERNALGQWVEVQKIVASDRDFLSDFGWDVDIDSHYAVIGAFKEFKDANGLNSLSNAGAAYVFERDINGIWNEAEKLVPQDRETGDEFGKSVAISKDYVVVGAYFEDEDEMGSSTMSNAGSAYIFKRSTGGDWNEVQKIVPLDRNNNDRFGISVDIDSENLVVGAYFEDENSFGESFANNSGAAYVYQLNSMGTWTEQQKITALDRQMGDYFGWEVSISGEYISVGSYTHDYDQEGGGYLSAAGAAYIFRQDDLENWNQVFKAVASDRESNDRLGTSVAISNGNLLTGANLKNLGSAKGEGSAGAAYFYTFNDTPIVKTIDTSVCGQFAYGSKYIDVSGVFYDTILSNNCGQDTVIVLNLIVVPQPSIALETEKSNINIIEDLTITASGAEYYLWERGDTTNEIKVSINGTTKYCVVGSNLENGQICSDTGCIFIHTPCGELKSFNPNAISRSSFSNNKLCFEWSECIKSSTLIVSDRWGNIIFTGQDNESCWDGLAAQIVNAGVYTYIYEVVMRSGEVIKRKSTIQVF